MEHRGRLWAGERERREDENLSEFLPGPGNGSKPHRQQRKTSPGRSPRAFPDWSLFSLFSLLLAALALPPLACFPAFASAPDLGCFETSEEGLF